MNITKGTKVTVEFKGQPFANTTVIRVFEKWGKPQLYLEGCTDEFGDLVPVSLSEIRPCTTGYYLTRPVDASRTFTAPAGQQGKPSLVAAGLI